MKKFVTLVSVLLVCISGIKAQTDIVIGTGTTGNSPTGSMISAYPCPLQDYSEGSLAQYLYLGSELAAAGMTPGYISSLGFNVLAANTGTPRQIERLAIKIGYTTKPTLDPSGTAWEPVKPIWKYDGIIREFLPFVGVNKFALDTAFYWNGTDNIVIQICNGAEYNFDYVSSTTNAVVTLTRGLPFIASYTFLRDNSESLCAWADPSYYGNPSTSRPNIIFSWTANAQCSGAPVAGIISGPSNICQNTEFRLSLNGATTSSAGLTYTWQKSPDNSSWSNIGTASEVYSSQVSSTYYRAILKCANTSLSDTSASFYVNTPPLVSGTFTINNAQPTGGANFNSFNDAVTFLGCGINGPVTFNVAAGSGPYNERVEIPQLAGSSASATVTINGNGAVLNYTTTDPIKRSAIVLNGTDYVIIDSLNINVSQGIYGWGVLMTAAADNNIIRKCTITTSSTATSNNFMGIVINGSETSLSNNNNGNNGNGNIITSNKTIGGYNGIFVYGGRPDGYLNQSNAITLNTIVDAYDNGIYIYGTYASLISSNDVSTITRSTGSGISAANCGASIIEKNRLHGLFGAGISISSPTPLGSSLPNKAENNLMYSFKGNNSHIGVSSFFANNWNVYHNTILLNDSTSTTGGAIGIWAIESNINVKNNMVSISRTGSGEKYCLYYGTTGVTSSNNNVLHMNSSAGSNNIVFYKVAYPTLAAWKGANGGLYDQQSVNADPLFTNPASDSLQPKSDMVNGIGAKLLTTKDINDTLRHPFCPDPGAYEFGASTANTYVFTGNGNWTVASNWSGGIVPPSFVPAGKEVFISPSSGSCVLDIPVTVDRGAKLFVLPGKSFLVQNNLTIL